MEPMTKMIKHIIGLFPLAIISFIVTLFFIENKHNMPNLTIFGGFFTLVANYVFIVYLLFIQLFEIVRNINTIKYTFILSLSSIFDFITLFCLNILSLHYDNKGIDAIWLLYIFFRFTPLLLDANTLSAPSMGMYTSIRAYVINKLHFTDELQKKETEINNILYQSKI